MEKFSKSQWKNVLFKLFIVAGAIVLDIISKVAFYGKDIELVPGVIGIRNAGALNTGGAWGLLGEHLWMLIAVTVLFLVVVVVVAAGLASSFLPPHDTRVRETSNTHKAIVMNFFIANSP